MMWCGAAEETARLCLEQEVRHQYSFYRPISSADAEESVASPQCYTTLLGALSRANTDAAHRLAKQISALFFDLLNKPLHPAMGAASAWDLSDKQVYEAKQDVIRIMMRSLKGCNALSWLSATLGLSTTAGSSSVDFSDTEEDVCSSMCLCLHHYFSSDNRPLQGGGPIADSGRVTVSFEDCHGEALFFSTRCISLVLGAMIEIGTNRHVMGALDILESAGIARIANHATTSSSFTGKGHRAHFSMRAAVAYCAEVAAQLGKSEIVTRLMFTLCRSEGTLAFGSLRVSAPNRQRGKGERMIEALRYVFTFWKRNASAERAMETRDQRHGEESLEHFTTRLLKSTIHAALQQESSAPEVDGTGQREVMDGLREANTLFEVLSESSSWTGIAAMAVELLTFTATTQQELFNKKIAEKSPHVKEARLKESMEVLARTAASVFGQLHKSYIAERAAAGGAGHRTVLKTCVALTLRSVYGMLTDSQNGVEFPVMCLPLDLPILDAKAKTRPSGPRAAADSTGTQSISSFIHHLFDIAVNEETECGDTGMIQAVLPFEILAVGEEAFSLSNSNSIRRGGNATDTDEHDGSLDVDTRIVQRLSRVNKHTESLAAVIDPEAFLSSMPKHLSSETTQTAEDEHALGGLLLYSCLCETAAHLSPQCALTNSTDRERSKRFQKLCRWLCLSHRAHRQQLWSILLSHPRIMVDSSPQLDQLSHVLYAAVEYSFSNMFPLPSKTCHAGESDWCPASTQEMRLEAAEILCVLYRVGCPPHKQLLAVVNPLYASAVSDKVATTTLEELSLDVSAIVVVSTSALKALQLSLASLSNVMQAIPSLLQRDSMQCEATACVPGSILLVLTKESVALLVAEPSAGNPHSSSGSGKDLAQLRTWLTQRDAVSTRGKHVTCTPAEMRGPRVVILPPLDRRGAASDGGGLNRLAVHYSFGARDGTAEAISILQMVKKERGDDGPPVFLWMEPKALGALGHSEDHGEVSNDEADRLGFRLLSSRRAQLSKAKTDILALMKNESRRSAVYKGGGRGLVTQGLSSSGAKPFFGSPKRPVETRSDSLLQALKSRRRK